MSTSGCYKRTRAMVYVSGFCLLLAACAYRLPKPAPPVPPAGAVAVYANRPDGTPLAGAAVYLLPQDRHAAVHIFNGRGIATVDLIDKQFFPKLLVVHVGTIIQFHNLDNVTHQIYSFSSNPPLDLGIRPNEIQRVVLPERAALLTLGSKIDSSMIGYILVTEADVFGRTDAQGFTSFDNVPPGRYQVRLLDPGLLHPGQGDFSENIVVKRNVEYLVHFVLR
mgnify:CR=1 FL=1